MFVQLDENDRIVLRYETMHENAYGVSATETIVVQDSEIDDIYTWMSRRLDVKENRWDLHWRGNWKSTSDNFFEFVQDVESDTAQVLAKRNWANIDPDDLDDLQHYLENVQGEVAASRKEVETVFRDNNWTKTPKWLGDEIIKRRRSGEFQEEEFHGTPFRSANLKAARDSAVER